MRRRWVLGGGLAGGLVAGVGPVRAAGVPPPVRVPRPPFSTQEETPYQRELLQLALRKAGWPDTLVLLPPQTWMRQVRELQSGHADVSPLPALQTEVYARYGLLRVNVPLRHGLLGLRRLITRVELAETLSRVPDLASLQRRYLMGYGASWGDLPLMRQLGFRVRTAASVEALYEMLRQGEVDFLSRGLNEIEGERGLREAAPGGLALVPGLVLSYPLDDCFFVAPGRADLHAAISRGLERAGRDGSHAALLNQHYGVLLDQLSGARVLSLRGYPVPPGLRAEQLQGWRSALSARPLKRVELPPSSPRP